jgi:hypothetical protein
LLSILNAYGLPVDQLLKGFFRSDQQFGEGNFGAIPGAFLGILTGS